MDLLRSMESFVGVVKAGSFAGAAAQLSMSRAIISKHIKDLEDHLGARLLYRTTRRLSLTEIGLRHYAFSVRILEELQAEHEQAAQLQGEPRGEIKLMAPKSFGNQFLATIIADFIACHPQISVSMLLSDDAPSGLNLIDNGVDLAIRLTEATTSSMIIRRVGTLRWLLCAAPIYLSKQGRPRKPAELAQHDCLLHLKYLPEGIWRLTKAGRETAVRVMGRFSANSSLAVRAGTLRGLGIAALPAYCVGEDLTEGRLVEVLSDHRLPPQPVFAIYPQQRLLPAKVRLLLDYLADRFESYR
ncbi:MAG: LysR substrate-binding domain-containing protein [Alphaproteobacteria bacterium]